VARDAVFAMGQEREFHRELLPVNWSVGPFGYSITAYFNSAAADKRDFHTKVLCCPARVGNGGCHSASIERIYTMRLNAPLLCLSLLAPFSVHGQTRAQEHAASQIPSSITTPSRVTSPIGALEFQDGLPTQATAQRLYDQLDLQRGIDAFMNGLRGVSMFAARKGIRDVGVADNDVLIFSGLMDSKSLFLTANADTVYFFSNLNLTKGPLVVETPPDTLGIFDDLWFRWVIDFGTPGPDRGEGGRYLLVPPGYTGPLPENGYFIGRPTTTSVALLGRAFLVGNDPKPAVDAIKKTLKIYPYEPGSYGTSVGSFLQGKAPLTPISRPLTPNFIEGTGVEMNTIPPNDFSYYEMLNALVQEQPAEALDLEIGGQFAAIGIVKGKPFNPDARMRKILTDAIAIGNGAARTVSLRPRTSEGFGYYGPSSRWLNPLFVGGYDFTRPPPEITKEGVKQFPYTGARTLDARTAFFYVATGVTPAMVMRVPDLGSQYLFAILDASGQPFDGAKTYMVTLPAGIPAAKFWSLTLYDNQTRSMLQSEQRFPRAGSQSYPSAAAVADADGTTTVYFAPRKPAQVADGNWIQTVPGKGWFVILRLYSPFETFFTKTWRPGDVQAVGRAAEAVPSSGKMERSP
jgi:hypothetical protein